MKIRHLVYVALAVLAFSAPVQAVTRYSCDFENEADRLRWVINPASASVANNLKNKWYIGEPGNNSRMGHNGLFISDDAGETAHYTNARSAWVYAYDTIALDHLASGNYTLYFDYSVMANIASKFDGVYLVWAPVLKDNGDTLKLMSVANGGSIPNVVKPYIIPLQPGATIDYLNGAPTWRQCSVTIPNSLCDGTPHYLAFVWTNGSSLAQQPAAKIDNILITDAPPCPAPTNLVVDPQGSTINVSWTGTAAEYEVSAYSYDGNAWWGPRTTTDNSVQITGLPIGEADFVVRAKCDDDYYSLKTITSKLIYYPDQLCVDYLNLDNAKCYISNPANFPDPTEGYNDFLLVSPVDKGSASIESRHTIHFDRQELEPRTGNLAKTVPDGELASVRLGNWAIDDGGARIEFSFDVDTINYPVLLLKYMPILEAPSHADNANPRFMLDILIGNQSIGRCGEADFNANKVMNGSSLTPGAEAQGWHVTPSEVAQTNADVIWKEWTTVGVNLRNKAYQGKTLTARLTTFDCSYAYHGGYAYFTLGCSDGKLKDMKCGEINPTFKAPDGFEYRWIYAANEKFRRADGSVPEQYVLGRSQTYDAGWHDDNLYVVDCMFVQDSTCYFSLYASTLATNPVSAQNKPEIKRSCIDNKYEVTFDATPSWVQEINHVTGDTVVSQSKHIERYEWVIEGISNGWSDEPIATFPFPIEGGDFPVTLRTTCGSCDNVLSYVFHLDPLGATRDTTTVVLCDDTRKTGYQWSEKPDTAYTEYGLDSIIYLNPATLCDSILYLNLLEPERIPVDTMLLPESLPFVFHGRIYDENTKSLIDTVPDPDNCAKTWVLNLEIYESLRADMPQTAYILCEGDGLLTLAYDITRGRSLRYSYSFDSPAIGDSLVNEQQKKGHYEIPITIDPDLYPNVYNGTLLLVDSMPEFSITIPFTLTMQYASSVIAQRWNDVLAIRNADYNGGYDFNAVEWYMDGAPIAEASNFNFYAADGLQMGRSYQALLTRADGVKLFTCAYIPSPVSAEITDMPSLVPPSSAMHVKGRGQASWYDTLGRLYHSDAYDDSDITTPATAGYYLLVLQNDDARAVHQVVVK